MNTFKKVLTFAAFLPFLAISQSVTIGTSTTSSNGFLYGPYYRSSVASTINYSKFAYLYTSDELTAIPVGSTITMIEWQKATGTITAPNNFQIFLENNANTALSAGTTWGALTSTATNVYTNTNQGFTVTGPGWEGFSLGTSFVYTGGSLQILTDFFRQGTASGANNFFYSPTPGKAIGWSNTAVGNSATTLNATTNGNNRPNIRISYTPPPTCTGLPDGGTTISTSTITCPSINYTLQLSNASQGDGIIYQWQSSTDGTSYTNIIGATNPSLTTSQNTNTFYQCIVTCVPSGQSGTSIPIEILTENFTNCYCSSGATTTFNEEILNVKLGSLDNSSNCSSIGGPGSVQSQYSNYTTTVAPPNLAATGTYLLNVSVGTCGTNNSNMTKVFIDYNQNGLFSDPGETVYASTAPSTGANIINSSIVIPSSALAGQTRMRVVTVQTSFESNVSSCGTYSWGETEDYLVNITPIPTCPQPTNINVIDASNSTALLQWTAGGNETQWQIEYGPQGFIPGTGSYTIVNSNPGAISGLTSNMFYDAYVRAVCSPGDSSIWTGLATFNTYNQGFFVDWDNTCPSGGFVDISSSGTSVPLNDEDEFALTLEFPIFFQGTPFTDATISNNGALILGTTTAQVPGNNTSVAFAQNGLYPFWDDLASTGTGIWFQTIGTAPNRKLIIMWDKDRVGAAGNALRFQLIIEEATQEMYYVYEDVLTGNFAYDNGLSATVGLAGQNQDIELSLNSTSYLTTNSCVHFVYTDCPKPTNLTYNYILSDGASLSWTPGIANETSWTVIYGPTGFDPTTDGITISSSTGSAFLPNLTQLTGYDVYIYANCAVGVESVGLFGTFETPPFCSNPTTMLNSTLPDTIQASWTWVESSANYPATGFNIQYGSLGFELYSGTNLSTDNNLSESIVDPTLLAGGVYDVYVQAVCNQDTSSFIGPFTVVMPLTNDSICGAELLPVNGESFVFNNFGATVTPTEATLAPPATGANTTDGWINSNLNLTTWFKFVAPSSGNVRINCTDINFNGQVAVYNSQTCDTVLLSNLIGANDNEIGGSSIAPNFTVCNLNPNQTYFLLHDAFTFTGGNYSISLSEINLNSGITGNQIDACFGDTVNLFDGISNYDQGGIWSQEIPTLGLQDSLFITTGLASVVFNFTYTLTDGCASDAVQSSVEVFSPSSAGNDGTINVCKNEPFLLLAGLTGNVDVGGTWYDPQNQPLSSNIDTAGNFPGQFNYDYIVTNGVCPNDTANVLVIVDPSCDYLAEIDENLAKQITIYPNPTLGKFQIDNSTNGLIQYKVTDLNQKIILEGENSNSLIELDIQNHQSGLYFIHIYRDGKEKIVKLIKN